MAPLRDPSAPCFVRNRFVVTPFLRPSRSIPAFYAAPLTVVLGSLARIFIMPVGDSQGDPDAAFDFLLSPPWVLVRTRMVANGELMDRAWFLFLGQFRPILW